MKVTLIDYTPLKNLGSFLFSIENKSYCYLDSEGIEVDRNKVRGADDPWCKQPKVLRAYTDILPSYEQIKRDSLKYLGFRKQSPRYNRGRIDSIDWWCGVEDELVVKEIFTDIPTEDKGFKVQITMSYYAEDGSISTEKTFINKTFNKYEAETEYRERRERQFDYLQASARGTQIEPYINIIMTHYQNEIHNYKQSKDMSIHSSMENETEQSIINILEIVVPRNDIPEKGISIRNSIYHQIGVLEIESLPVIIL